jgi:hypothetical protein
MQLYVDMDGVLADFDRHHEKHFGIKPSREKDNVDWEDVRSVPNFFRTIPPMLDAMQLWDGIKHMKPIVLTGVPQSLREIASANKKAWVASHIPGNPKTICCRSKEKYLFAKAGDILIDDWEKYRYLWEGRGARWIAHTSAVDTLKQLEEWGHL